jgi:hypothetical protein
MKKMLLLGCFAILLNFFTKAQSVESSANSEIEIVLEYSGQMENEIDSIFNVVALISNEDMEKIDKVHIKKAKKNEDTSLEELFPSKNRKKQKTNSKKQKIVLCKHSPSNPFQGVDFIDSKGKKIKN